MEISEAKVKKASMEEDIRKRVLQFENETRLIVTDLQILRGEGIPGTAWGSIHIIESKINL